ncbi:hypothetical protein OIDMADRAFT_19549 [Oidiodendron maius Zn]|uniref:Uncharacterized protein n=1 Tax=Oidiodendron maius (strain Zn) TaxID=913774 RepID=A0A0C3CN72_OIDMZ|nr:hypothetical protein OIDMADRAFT_19549 [Oidiodendron maius Zn]
MAIPSQLQLLEWNYHIRISRIRLSLRIEWESIYGSFHAGSATREEFPLRRKCEKYLCIRVLCVRPIYVDSY